MTFRKETHPSRKISKFPLEKISISIAFQQWNDRKSDNGGWRGRLMYWLAFILVFVGALYGFLAIAIGRILKAEIDEFFESQTGGTASKDERNFIEASDDWGFKNFERGEKG
jgi:hypothetical protein